MRSIAFFGAIGYMLLTFSACSPTLSPFTQDLYREYRWSDDELERIQFYLSDDIILRRDYSGGTSEIIAGEIKVIEGREVEEVIIRRGTPGVFLFSPKSNRFAISFEDRNGEKFLMFGPNPKMGDRYALLGSEWNRRYGVVTYGGRKYRVDARSAYATLMVDLKKVRRVSKRSRTAQGRRVQQ